MSETVSIGIVSPHEENETGMLSETSAEDDLERTGMVKEEVIEYSKKKL